MIANIPTSEELKTLKEIAEILIESGLYQVPIPKKNDDDRQEYRTLKTGEALAKILRGLPLGLTPSESLEGINIVRNKLTMGAALMGTLMKRAGYDWTVDELTDRNCKLTFVRGGKIIGVSEFSLADAQKAKIVSAMYGKFPRNMLMARALSNAAKWFAQDAFGGAVYTPEELEDKRHTDDPQQPQPQTAPNVTPIAPMPPVEPQPEIAAALDTMETLNDLMEEGTTLALLEDGSSVELANTKQTQKISMNFDAMGFDDKAQDDAIRSVSGGNTDSRKALTIHEAEHLIGLQHAYLRAINVLGEWTPDKLSKVAQTYGKGQAETFWEMSGIALQNFNVAMDKRAGAA